MIILGWVMVLCCGAAYFLSGSTPFSVLAVFCFLIGFSAVSWNGVFHAALIEVSPPGETVQAIAGMAFYVYIAMFVWPALFAFLIEKSGIMSSRYSVSFVCLVLIFLGWPAEAKTHGRCIRPLPRPVSRMIGPVHCGPKWLPLPLVHRPLWHL